MALKRTLKVRRRETKGPGGVVNTHGQRCPQGEEGKLGGAKPLNQGPGEKGRHRSKKKKEGKMESKYTRRKRKNRKDLRTLRELSEIQGATGVTGTPK